MRFVDLAEHLHKLREVRSGRLRGAAMRASEVWACVAESQLTDITEVRYFDQPLPRPFDGLFARMGKTGSANNIAIVVTHKQLPKHWKEFAAVKEMMHCWSVRDSYVGTPQDAANLVDALVNNASRYSASVAR